MIPAGRKLGGLLQEMAVDLPDHNRPSHEIRVPLIEKAGIPWRPFKRARAVRMIRVINGVAKIV
jgi:hypothetical protein